MKLVPGFEIGSFVRTIWLNRTAKEVWEKPARDAAQFAQALEVMSVAEGHRPCSWQTVNEERVTSNVQEWANLGLVSLPVKEVAQFNGFAHRHEKVAPGGKKAVCYVVSKDIGRCQEYRKAFESGDNIEQGRLLGFPECCSHFFAKSWSEGYFDPMWQLAKKSTRVELGERRITVLKAHPYSNPLLRYVGLRVGFHIPCSFDCKQTVFLASQRLSLARKVDESLVVVLDALLRMPMKWDVLHGLAVVKTPIFYLVVQSVPTIERHVVQVEGSFVPKEAEDAVCNSE